MTAHLQRELDEANLVLHTVAEALTACRLAAAAEFSERVEQELAYLDMAGVRFSITRREKPYGPTGADEMEFMICTNTGEEAKPLAKIASGGELARIMLAIKNVLAEKDGIGTIIFDEVDTGVSGRAAQKIGKKLAEVARPTVRSSALRIWRQSRPVPPTTTASTRRWKMAAPLPVWRS